MQTSELVTLIKREASGWSRDLIRSLINNMQFMMMAKPLAQTRIIDPDTGLDPVLTTTAADFTYYGNTTDIPQFPAGVEAWRIVDVYTGNIDDDTYEQIKCTKFDGTVSAAAYFTLQTDPGVSSYNIRAYKKPTAVTSESIELTIPENKCLDTLYEGVMGWIEKTDNGKSERWNNFIVNLLPLYWAEANWNISDSEPKQRRGGF